MEEVSSTSLFPKLRTLYFIAQEMILMPGKKCSVI